jgi:hypothetical protein
VHVEVVTPEPELPLLQISRRPTAARGTR